MTRAKKAKPPAKNPVSDAHVLLFDQYIKKHQALLNLRDWRIERAGKREKAVMAALLSVEHEHKLARYAVGTDFGAAEVTPHNLEATAVHELLHLFLRPLMDVCMAEGEHNDTVLEYEHAVIIVLTQLLVNAYGDDAE